MMCRLKRPTLWLLLVVCSALFFGPALVWQLQDQARFARQANTSLSWEESTFWQPHVDRIRMSWNESILHQPQQERSYPTPPMVKWQNRYNLVHVIYTRFMIDQANLTQLGLARLRLFETFCFPTLLQQTDADFLWIVRTDPDLHPIVANELIRVVSVMPNVVVVKSRTGQTGSLPKFPFRDASMLVEITPQSILYGSHRLVESYHEASQHKTLIETVLDADDGLALDFVELIQNQTANVMKVQKSRRPTSYTHKRMWFIWCIGSHWDWQFYGSHPLRGEVKSTNSHLCVTPGLSQVSQAQQFNTSRPPFVSAHHKIKKRTSRCPAVETSSSTKKWKNCWAPLPVTGLAIRARSPTSTGMGTVDLPSNNNTSIDRTDWSMLSRDFGISLPLLEASRQAILEDLPALIEENLRGQCRRGHSCKKHIYDKLRSWGNHSTVLNDHANASSSKV